MPRTPRAQQAGFVYHVINRGNGRATIFHKAQDYQAFLSILALECGILVVAGLGSDPANCLIYRRKIGIKGVV
jgi:hypothetical protein